MQVVLVSAGLPGQSVSARTARTEPSTLSSGEAEFKQVISIVVDHTLATGMLGPIFISVVYVQRGARKRIISAFEADDDDIADYMVTYAIDER